MEHVAAHEAALGARLYEGLAAFGDRLELYGPTDAADRGAALVAFNARGVHAADLATFLDLEGVACRAGHHCTQPLHAELVRRGRSAYDGSARASLYIYNTRDEIDRLCEELESTIELFRSME